MTEHQTEHLSPEQALALALQRRGAAAEIARACGISAAAVAQWTKCPPERVLVVERISEGRVTRHQLRPDLYPLSEQPLPVSQSTEAA